MPGVLAEPVLTVAFNNIQKLTTIDESDIQTIWNVFTKCKDNLENGRRLENISWRLWYRSCHGQSPKEDASPLAIPDVHINKHTKGPQVSPESFNRILKNAVEDSKKTARKETLPPDLAAMKAAAAACISPACITQEQPQQPASAPAKQETEPVVLSPPVVRIVPPVPAPVQRTQSSTVLRQQAVPHYTAPHTPSQAPQYHVAPAALQQHHQQMPAALNSNNQQQPEQSRNLLPSYEHLYQPQPQRVVAAQQHLAPERRVKFFISTPSPSGQPNQQATTRTNQAAYPGRPLPPRQEPTDDDDFSDSDFSSDFSDSDYSDDESDYSSGDSGRKADTLFKKVSLIPSSHTSTVALTPKRSLLSVALKEGSALKRAKPSQFRNLNAMGRFKDEETSATLSHQCQGPEGDLSESLRENLACERRMMPHNMRYARGVPVGAASQGVFSEEGYW